MMEWFFDIDGTITNEVLGHDYAKRTPKLEVIAYINSLYLSGDNKIILWTARWWEDREVTEKWLIEHKVKYHSIMFGKPTFDVYVCDKVINVRDLPI